MGRRLIAFKVITDTDVNWGTQSTAVGFIASANAAANTATGSNTLFVPTDVATYNFTPIAANGTNASTITGTPELAYENYTANNGENNETAGSFAYLFLGVQPTKPLTANTNKFTIVLVPQGTGTTVGIAAAIHVAYRSKLADGNWSNWADVDVYDSIHYTAPRTGNGAPAAVTLNGDLTTDFTETTDSFSNGVTTAPTGSAAFSIALSNYSDANSAAPIDQIELIIYLAGHDSDCINSAINSMQTKVYMFFEAQVAA